MSQAAIAVNPPVINESVINAIDVLAATGHISLLEQCDILKKMILNTVNPAIAPVQVASAPTVDATNVETPTELTPTGITRRVRTRVHLPTEDVEVAVAKIKLGVDCLEVARDAGVSSTTIRNICNQHGLEYKTRYGASCRRLTSDEQQKIKDLYNSGKSIVEIQILMDASSSVVSKYSQ